MPSSPTLKARMSTRCRTITDIDLAAFEWLAECLAVMVASDFGQEPNEGKRMKAENMLLKISASRPSKETVTADYF
jgi:hypothetical protein